MALLDDFDSEGDPDDCPVCGETHWDADDFVACREAAKRLPPALLEAARRSRKPPPWEEETVDHAPPAQHMTHDELSALMHRAAMAKSRIGELELTAQKDRERIVASIQDQLARVEHWLASETEADRRTVVEVESLAEQWLRNRLAEADAAGDKNAKRSTSTPWGRITSRRQEPEYLRDEAVLLAWATEHGYTRPRDPVVDWERLKKAIATGAVTDVAGVAVEPRDPLVTVEILP